MMDLDSKIFSLLTVLLFTFVASTEGKYSDRQNFISCEYFYSDTQLQIKYITNIFWKDNWNWELIAKMLRQHGNADFSWNMENVTQKETSASYPVVSAQLKQVTVSIFSIQNSEYLFCFHNQKCGNYLINIS